MMMMMMIIIIIIIIPILKALKISLIFELQNLFSLNYIKTKDY